MCGTPPKKRQWLPWVLFCLALIIAVSAVTAWWVERKDQTVKRWSKLDDSADDPAFLAMLQPVPVRNQILGRANWQQSFVSVYSFPASKTLPVTLMDLTAEGQAHAIDFLAKNTKAEPHTWSDLQEGMTNARSATVARNDPYKFERVLVSTVTRGADWPPGDRMIWTRIFVQPINFEFGDYVVAATQDVTDKIASVEATRSNKVSGDLAIAIPGSEGPKADLAPSTERSVKTTTDINSQYEKLGVDIQRDFLRIIRESNPGRDVVGNALIPLSLVTDPATIQKKFPDDTNKRSISDDLVLIVTGIHLTDETGDLREDKASISVLPQAPLPHCPLIARVWMLYEQRHIVKYGEFYDESQQEVTLVRKADGPRDVEIVPADDVSPAVWYIQVLPQTTEQPTATSASGDTTNGQATTMLKGHVYRDSTYQDKDSTYRDQDRPYRDIVFSDYGQASSFAHWVRYNYRTKIGGLSLNYPAGASLVPFKMTDIVCGPEDKTHMTEATYQAKPMKE